MPFMYSVCIHLQPILGNTGGASATYTQLKDTNMFVCCNLPESRILRGKQGAIALYLLDKYIKICILAIQIVYRGNMVKVKDLVRHKKLGWIGQVREIENQQKACHYCTFAHF